MLNQLSVQPIIDGVVSVVSIGRCSSIEPVSYDDIIIEIARKIYPVDSLQMVILSSSLPQLTLTFLVSELSGKYELFFVNSYIDSHILHRLRDGKVYESENVESFKQLAMRALADI